MSFTVDTEVPVTNGILNSGYAEPRQLSGIITRMGKGSFSRNPFISAAIAGFSLTALFVAHLILNGTEYLQSDVFVIGSIIFIIALITVVTYQSIRIHDSAEHLAENIAQDILLYSHELFSELYRSSPVPYILIDSDGIIESTNLAAVRLFHVSDGELSGAEVFNLLESDDANRVGLISEKFKQGIFVNEEEVQIVRLDGTRRWVMLSLFSFRDSERKRKGLLTLVDITKQKEIDRAKTEFVSLASHQLRTPISAMKWNVELLHTAAPSSFTPLQEEYLLKIARGLTRMELLIDDFLNVSKLELGTLTASVTRLELTDFIEELLEGHRKRADEHHLTIDIEWSEKPFSIETDPHLLTMIIENLVSNALKYTPDGGAVRLSFTRDGEHVVISVSDTGLGIPDDEHDQIFSKIFRASNVRDSIIDGTGLGLYIVREATKVLGGTVTFVSKENVGTTFTIVLPR